MSGRSLKTWLQAALALLLLAWLLRSVAWAQLLATVSGASPAWVLGSIAMVIVQTVASAWRWQQLLEIALGERLPLLALTRYYFISGFFNNFLPANIAGDLMRAGTLFTQGRDKLAVSSSVIAERILNLLGLLLLAAWALIGGVLPIRIGGSPALLIGGAVAAVMGLVATLFVWRFPPTRLRLLVERVATTARLYAGAPWALAGALALTMAIHVLMMLITYCTFRAVGLDLSLSINLAVYAIAALALTLPLTIQGIGVREGVYVGLLALVGVARELPLAALTINYFIVVLISITGALLFWASFRGARSRAA